MKKSPATIAATLAFCNAGFAADQPLNLFPGKNFDSGRAYSATHWIDDPAHPERPAGMRARSAELKTAAK